MSEIRPAANGCYGVVDLSGWFAACTRILTRSKWSHAFVVLDADNGVILEACPSGSAIGKLSAYMDLPLLFSEPAPQAARTSARLLTGMARSRWTGIKYGYLDIAALGLYYTVHKRPKWLTDLVLNDKRQICSQLTAEWGASYGADWQCGQADPQFVTPGLLGKRLN